VIFTLPEAFGESKYGFWFVEMAIFRVCGAIPGASGMDKPFDGFVDFAHLRTLRHDKRALPAGTIGP
jgi:hypothetical protein